MVRIIKEFFMPPAFPEDEDKDRTARVLYSLLMNMLVVLPIVALATIFIYDQKTASFIALLFMFILTLVSGALLKHGQVRLASLLYVVGIWILATLGLLLTGRISTSMTSLHIAVTIAAGILLGRRAAIIFALLSSSLGLGLALLEYGGYPLIQFLPVTPLTGWIIWVLAIHWTITPLYQTLKRSDQALLHARQSRKRFETLFNEGPMAYLTIRDEGDKLVITDCNAAFFKPLGYTREQVVGQPLERFYSSQSFSAFLEEDFFQQALQNGINSSTERELIAQDGRIHHILVRVAPEVDEEEKGIGVLAMGLDITERKRAEAERQVLLDIMKGAVVTKDLQGLLQVIHQSLSKVIYAENFFVLLFNKDTSLFEETYVVDQFDPQGMPPSALQDSMSAYVQRTGESFLFTDAAFDELARKGEVKLVGSYSPSWLGVPLKTSGDTIGVMVVQDYNTPNRYQESDVEFLVSIAGQVALAVERKQGEEALIESEVRFRDLSAMTSEGIMVHVDGVILDANTAFARLAGYSNPGDLIGKNGLEIIPLTPGSRQLIFDRLGTGSTETFEIELIKADGSTFPAETYGKEITYQARQARLVSMRDITERKQAEEALRRSEETFAKAFKASPIILVISSISNGQIIEVNETFEKVTGYTRQEAISSTVEDLKFFVDPTELDKLVQFILAEGRVRDTEQLFRIKSGEVLTTNYSAEMIDIAGEKFVLAVIENITERKRAEEHVQNQLERLNALHNIDNAIKSSIDLRTTFEVFLDVVVTQLKIDAASILLFNMNTFKLESAASSGFHSAALEYTSLAIGQGYAGRVIQDRKAIHIPDLTQEENPLTEALARAGEKFSVYIGCPLIAKNQVVGVLEIFQRSSFTPDSEWFGFLEILASQAAIAIDSSQLFENLQRANFDLTLAYDATIEGWSRAMDLRDHETEGHSQRVTSITIKLAKQMGMKDNEIIHLRRGALLHDIGKMGIPDEILLKPGKLTEEEWKIMHRHPTFAYEMLLPIRYLIPALDIPHYHHEKWDGTGYPDKLKGNAIPLAARIFAVVDVWDALSSNRPYRKAWLNEKVIEHIRTLSGTHFEPKIVELFLKMLSDDEYIDD